MASDQTQFAPEKLARELERNRSATPWSQRRQWGKIIAEEIRRNGATEALTDLLRLLADDPKWEVRKEVADCLILVDEGVFAKLAAQLSQDDNSFVRKSTQRSMDRRRRGQKISKQRSQKLNDVQSQYDSLEKLHGPVVAQKARQMGERLYDILVGATVHDMRGLITPLKSNVTSLLSLVNEGRVAPKVFRKHLGTMHDRLVIVERLLEDMRNYSQPTPSQRHRESIAGIVTEARSIVLDGFASANRDASNVEFALDIPVNLTAEVSRQSIVMAIYNLIKNAYESFAGDPKTFTQGTVTVTVQTVDNGRIEIIVRDDGMGLSQEELIRVREFIPGGTSKKTHGTGFGLPTARRRILDHGGQLAIHSDEGCGTTIIVTLPIKEQVGDE